MFTIDLPPDTPPPRHAVVADADPARRGALAALLRRRGFTVAVAADAMAALTLMGEQDTALALMAHDGAERAAALAVALYPRTRILLTVPATAVDGTIPDAPPGSDAPFPLLPLDSNPDALAARLDRWLSRLIPLTTWTTVPQM